MPKIVDHDQRRSDLVEAAVDAIADLGLERATLREIARRAEATTGTISHYFRDKDELLVATLHHIAERLSGPSAEKANVWYDGVGLHLPLDASARRYWKVWLAYCGAAPANPRLLEAYRGFYEGIETSIAAHLRERGMPARDADDAAGTIVAAVDGIGLCATVAPTLWPAARQRMALNRLLDTVLSTDSHEVLA